MESETADKAGLLYKVVSVTVINTTSKSILFDQMIICVFPLSLVTSTNYFKEFSLEFPEIFTSNWSSNV